MPDNGEEVRRCVTVQVLPGVERSKVALFGHLHIERGICGGKMDKGEGRSIRMRKLPGSPPFEEGDLVPGGIGEHERSGSVRLGVDEELLDDAGTFHPAVVFASREIGTDGAHKCALLSEGCDSRRDICRTPAEVDLPVKYRCRAVGRWKRDDPGDIIYRGMAHDRDHNSCTSLTSSGMSRNAFPITDFAILAACSFESARNTFISSESPTRAVFATIMALFSLTFAEGAGQHSGLHLNVFCGGIQSLACLRDSDAYRIFQGLCVLDYPG